ncbi:hypothetical protein SDC9_191966 [bioreactor metagenome]|uniref:Uncharacterized protein n=1 Tax=bioreactor metagenome TaxID=1076179 RepID=A0A645HZC3_9ZZZZ
MPASIASSIIICIVGTSIIGNISFDIDFVIGKNLVPKPAAGITAFLIFLSIIITYSLFALIHHSLFFLDPLVAVHLKMRFYL